MLPQKISHFDIIEKLGAGGMGVVYKAFDTKLKRNVAVKALAPHIAHHPDFRKRFLLEAKAAAALNHPNITTIYETIEENDEAYIVMEFIEGEELSKKVSASKLSVLDALDLAIQIADGLSTAHKSGIVHRDIKSDNIMVTKSNLVKIMDFGLARFAGLTMMTQVGTTVGTINYMSPEQTRGDEIDQRTDLWALGIILYEMLSGKLPFKADYEQAVIYSILNEKPKPIIYTEENIPPELSNIVDRLLCKLPDDRYASANDVLQDLKAVKKSIETGIPVEHLKSGTNTAAYISKLRMGKNVSPGFNRKKTIAISAGVFILLFIMFIKGNDLLKIFSDSILPDEKHLAVLSFENMGKDSIDQVFFDGLGEAITSQLSQFEQFEGNLWVVPASEIRRGKITGVEEAFKKFKINLAITGSVQKLSQGYRVTLNLIDAVNNRQLSSRIIDDPMTSTSFLQDEAIIKVADMLNIELKPKNIELLKAGNTTNGEAYELYLKGYGSLVDLDNAININSAIELFKRAINKDSLFALAYAGLGKAQLIKYRRVKDIKFIESAIISCNKAIELDAKLSSVRITLGSIYLETGKNNEAKEEFQKVLEIDPHNVEAYYKRGTALLELGMINEAEASYKKAVELKPDYWRVYNYLAYFYYSQGRYREAAAQYQKVIILSPDNATAYRMLGTVNVYLDLPEKAIELYNKSLQIEPDYLTYAGIAHIYRTEGKYIEAARAYENALKLNSLDYLIWGYLATCYYWAQGERSKAKEATLHAISQAEQQLKISPQNMDILCSLASYYGFLGERSKSLSLLKKVEELKPKEFLLLFNIGVVYEEWLGEREVALKWIKEAIEKGYPVKQIYQAPNLRNLIADTRFKSIVKYVSN